MKIKSMKFRNYLKSLIVPELFFREDLIAIEKEFRKKHADYYSRYISNERLSKLLTSKSKSF